MSELKQAVETIQQILARHNIQAERFFLFGSRARGHAHPDSDWDIYIVLDHDLSFTDRRRIVTEIKRVLAHMRIPNDIILGSARHFDELKEHPGSLAYEVMRDGIVL